MAARKVVLIPGDGIGPEITEAVLRVLDAAGVEIRLDSLQRRYKRTGEGRRRAASGNRGSDQRAQSGLVRVHVRHPLVKAFPPLTCSCARRSPLYAAVRSVRNLPGVETRYENVDLIIVRENTEGLYSGVVPGANYGDEEAIFEAVHGSAPDIAGKNIANPLALLMSAVMLLNYLAENDENSIYAKAAEKIRAAYDQALLDGAKTRDLGGELNTQEFADAVIARL